MKHDPFSVPRPPNGTGYGRPSDFELSVGQHVMALKHSICLDHDRLLEMRTRELQEEIADLQKENITLRRSCTASQPNDVCRVALRRHVLTSVAECGLPPVNESSEVFEAFDFPSVLRTLADRQEQALEVLRTSMSPSPYSNGNGYHVEASDNIKAGAGDVSMMNGIVTSAVAVSVIDDRTLKKHVTQGPWGGVRNHEPWPIWKEASLLGQPEHKDDRQVPAILGGVGCIRGSTMKFNAANSRSWRHRYCKWIINPNSMFCAVWQLVFAVVLMYEIIMFPMAVFEIPVSEGPLFVVSQAALIFWSLDLGLSFLTGYVRPDGSTETDHRRILMRYLKTWFVPDIAVVMVDWMTMLSTGTGNRFLRFGKMLRIIRVARLLRLVRLRKLTEAIRRLDDWIDSRYFSTIKSLVINMAGILMIAHFLGCGWYAIGMIEAPEYGSWVTAYPEVTMHTWAYRYVTSLHWSLTQFTPGSMHVQPQNISERLFAISVLVMGMLIFSCIISNITAATNNLKEMTARYDRQVVLLRRFLRQECVSPELLVRVCSYADSAIKPKMMQVAKEEVNLLNLLPKQLYEEVTRELYGKHLEVHPFFGTLSVESPLTMQKLSSHALDELSLPRATLLFKVGDRAHAMYFTTNGTMTYKLDDEMEDRDYVDTVGIQEWFCEPVLWMPWVYQGWMRSASDVDLVTLEVEKFHKVMAESPSSMWLPRQYGLEYVRGVNLMMQGIRDNGQGPRNNRVSDILVIQSAVRLVSGVLVSGESSNDTPQ